MYILQRPDTSAAQAYMPALPAARLIKTACCFWGRRQEFFMKTKMLILLVASAATLSGCMVYPRHGYGHRGEAGPTYIYSEGEGRHDDSDKRRGHRRHHDGDHGERRDRDRDGTPDRYDRAPHNPNFR
jgi:hypothetical protein